VKTARGRANDANDRDEDGRKEWVLDTHFVRQKLMKGLDRNFHVVAYFGYEDTYGFSHYDTPEAAEMPASLVSQETLSTWAKSVGSRLDNKCTFIVADNGKLYAIRWYDGNLNVTSNVTLVRATRTGMGV
jgi:hypothetical protein